MNIHREMRERLVAVVIFVIEVPTLSAMLTTELKNGGEALVLSRASSKVSGQEARWCEMGMSESMLFDSLLDSKVEQQAIKATHRKHCHIHIRHSS